MNNQPLNMLALFFFVAFGAVISINLVTTGTYRTNNDLVAKHLAHEGLSLSYQDLFELQKTGNLRDHILVDLRPASEFGEGHLEGAVNIPLDQMHSRRSRAPLNKDKPVLLYAGREHEAVAAQLILLGQGYAGVKFLPGGYHEIYNFVNGEYSPGLSHYSEDKARFNFRSFAGSNAETHGDGPRQPLKVPEASPPPAVISGGC